MGAIGNIRAYVRVLTGTRLQRMPEQVRLLIRRPAIALGVGTFEAGLVLSGRADAHLKALADIKTAALVGCPF